MIKQTIVITAINKVNFISKPYLYTTTSRRPLCARTHSPTAAIMCLYTPGRRAHHIHRLV